MSTPRNILVFSDGTGNSPGKVFRTNVWRLYKAVDLADPQDPKHPRQFAYYDDGVGTSSFKPLAVLGGALGVGLARNVRDLYAFVCRTYRPGDQIYAFGFSRGAFTARVLVGLVLNQGIIPYAGDEADLKRKVAAAYRAYRRERFTWRSQPHVALLRRARDAVIRFGEKRQGLEPYSKAGNYGVADPTSLTVRFVGVWDTVAAYGLPIDELTHAVDLFIWPLSMPDRDLNPRVERAMHALAFDDERNTFHPQLWNEGPPRRSSGEAPNAGRPAGAISSERLSQVWFAGVHSDVGGGYADDGLSYVPLEWMMTGAEQAGVQFCRDLWNDYRALSDENGPLHNSRKGLAGYYRYNPRRIERLTHTDQVTIERTKVHESALRRIRVGQDGYAPIVLPPDFDVVEINGTIVSGETYLKPDPQVGQDVVPEETGPELDLRERDLVPPLGPGSGYAVAREHVFNWVWWRRIAYFATLGTTLVLALFPVWWPALPKGACASSLCFVSEWVSLLSLVFPGFAATWTDAFASHPNVFLLLVVLIAAGLWAGGWCEGRIRDEMRRIWYAIGKTTPRRAAAFPRPREPNRLNRAIESVRTRDWYRDAFRFLTHKALPTAFFVAVAYVAVSLLTRLVFTIQDSGGWVCTASPSATPVTAQAAEVLFRTDALCSPTGLRLAKGGTYRLRFTIPANDRWRDDTLVTDPGGLHPKCVTLPMTMAVPLRRRLNQPWFKPMARIGEKGTDDYALDTEPSLPEREPDRRKGCDAASVPLPQSDTVFESEIVARSSGELFLYVNDAVFLPPFKDAFYRKNHGSARVMVRLVGAPP